MDTHFDQELAALKEDLLKMSAWVSESVAEALRALVERDNKIAQKVDEGDDRIDKLHMGIDDRCVQLIALREPKAKDLRFIVMTMKIVTDLERIADQAVNIAHRAVDLNKEPLLKPLVDIPHMAERVQVMIRNTLEAFVYGKVELARSAILQDDDVDQLKNQLHRELTSYMIENPKTIARALNLMSVVHNLERIGDHASNIAEEVIYVYEAKDIRHQHEHPVPKP